MPIGRLSTEASKAAPRNMLLPNAPRTPMLYNQELRDAGRAFNSKPFRTAPPKQHDAKERLHGSDRCPCSHISRQDRLASGRRRGRLLPHRHVRRRHGGAPAVRAAACAHHALHRAFGGHDAGQRGIHQQLHRRAVPTAPRVHRFMAMHQDYPEPEKEIERAIGWASRA